MKKIIIKETDEFGGDFSFPCFDHIHNGVSQNQKEV